MSARAGAQRFSGKRSQLRPVEIPPEAYERKQSWATRGPNVQRLVGENSWVKRIAQGSRGIHGEYSSVARKLAYSPRGSWEGDFCHWKDTQGVQRFREVGFSSQDFRSWWEMVTGPQEVF